MNDYPRKQCTSYGVDIAGLNFCNMNSFDRRADPTVRVSKVSLASEEEYLCHTEAMGIFVRPF